MKAVSVRVTHQILRCAAGFHNAREDLRPERCFVVYSGADRHPKAKGVKVIGLKELASLVIGV